MLQGYLLKNHAGLMLCGDYLSLRQLYDVITDVSDSASSIDPQDLLMALAYDVRKAYEGKCETIAPPEHYPEVGARFGVKLLWPTLLYQCALLRTTLKYADSSREEQGVTYLLENVLDAGLKEDFPAEYFDIAAAWKKLEGACSSQSPCERIDTGAALFCSWRNAQRREKLAGLLQAYDPLYDHLYPHLNRSGAKGLVDPTAFAAFEDMDEPPNPRW